MTEVKTEAGATSGNATACAEISDQAHLKLRIKGRRIAGKDFLVLKATGELLKQAQEILEISQSQAKVSQARAYEEGLKAGFADASKKSVQCILDAQAESRALLTRCADRPLEMAEDILRRVLPKLSQKEIIPELLQAALAEIQSERYLTVRVHPEQLSLVRQQVDKWQQAHPHIPEIPVEGDVGMEPSDCIVSSELGELHVGLWQQIAQLKAAVYQAME